MATVCTTLLLQSSVLHSIPFQTSLKFYQIDSSNYFLVSESFVTSPLDLPHVGLVKLLVRI